MMSMSRSYKFFWVDVFAAAPLTGNPLAIVVNADDLETEVMQKIAREFNQSETTFLLRSLHGEADWRLRSFTPTGAEVFGAGHNSLGAWWWLAESGNLTLDRRTSFVQEIGGQLLPIEIIVENGRPVLIVLTQAAPVFGGIVEDPDDLAHSLGLSSKDLALDQIPAQVVSTGVAHLMVPIRGRETVDRIRPRAEELLAVLQSVEGQGCYVFSLDGGDDRADTYARFFNPTVGIMEDPATGSAAGPLACHLAAHNLLTQETLLVEQGTAMGRTSFIRARLAGGTVQILGGGITIAEGILKIH